jgi:aspartate aminotransferase-like enzyme
MKKKYLLTPGPTPVPDDVRLAEAQPIIHHRTKEFLEIFDRISEDLKIVFKTKNIVLTFLSSGTGAMEGAVANTLSPGDKALCIIGGKFGERWAEICQTFGIEIIPLNVEWGDYAKPEEVKNLLKAHPDIKAVFATLCETSTGTLFPIEKYGKIIRNLPETILIVDAISGLAACDMETDNWNVDICVSASQKGLMLPPGLSFVSVSEKAWKFIENSKCPKYYFNFKEQRKALEKKEPTPYTPGISLINALDKSLAKIKKEGIDKVILKSKKIASALREAVKALGLELLSKNPADAVTAIKVPQGVDGAALQKILDEKYGVQIAGGQGHLKNKIIRIAHMGYIGKSDIITAISALESSLKDLKYPVKIGQGVKMAKEMLKSL